MGFSVSGATAIILLAGVLAFGMAFTAGTNSFDVVSDAQDDQSDRLLDQQNSAVDVTSVTFNDTAGELEVTVENDGSIELSVERTTLVVDGELQSASIVETRVEGETDTDVWLPGETLTFVVDADSDADRVKVTAETGVADLEVVDDA